ncbi:endonuclease/exonuclease/phosphatase family protein [Bifidobacterium gallicum]|nr:endonuclease/exonuclease/phosphatase family protein [Bifidobacterium gallicum]KFI57685.1 endonuclease/exonuclease/phosphatase [Bifidobacterium gallicum DSM 20093 = LMG 11596]
MKHHAIARMLSGVLTLIAAVACVLRLLPEDMQAYLGIAVVLAYSPWVAVIAIIGCVLACIGRRWVVAFAAIVCIAAQVYWQTPFFHSNDSQALSQKARDAVAQPLRNTQDAVMRVMTLDANDGHADATAIVDTVRDQHVELLALQHTTPALVDALNTAGIDHELPYSIHAASRNGSGSGIWAAAPLSIPADSQINSTSSKMPAGTVQACDRQLRFVSVTTEPMTWSDWQHMQAWHDSLMQLAALRTNTDHQFVLLGDFNATNDHGAFREILGTRFHDAAIVSGHGFAFTWPANIRVIPALNAPDHILVEEGVRVGQVQTVRIPQASHKALLATLDCSNMVQAQ